MALLKSAFPLALGLLCSIPLTVNAGAYENMELKGPVQTIQQSSQQKPAQSPHFDQSSTIIWQFSGSQRLEKLYFVSKTNGPEDSRTTSSSQTFDNKERVLVSSMEDVAREYSLASTFYFTYDDKNGTFKRRQDKNIITGKIADHSKEIFYSPSTPIFQKRDPQTDFLLIAQYNENYPPIHYKYLEIDIYGNWTKRIATYGGMNYSNQEKPWVDPTEMENPEQIEEIRLITYYEK